MNNLEPLVSMKGITKSFPGVRAVDSADLEVRRGEILGLIGENGAGKTTLMKVLMGIEQAEAGEILLRGAAIKIGSPAKAFRAGVGMVFQEQALLPNLRVCENVFLGHEDSFLTAGVVDWKKMNQEAKLVLSLIGLEVDPDTNLQSLSFPQRQMVEIARALAMTRYTKDNVVVILDEPTAVLSPHEVETLFEKMNAIREHAAFVFISHRMPEIMRYTDRIVVMKDGTVVGERRTKDTSIHELQALMVGREFSEDFYCESDQREPTDEVVLEVKNLKARGVEGIDLKLNRGEILGLAGLVGCGKEEVLRAIFGDEPRTGGQVIFGENGRKHEIGVGIKSAMAMGIGYVPSDRRMEGVIGDLSVLANLTLSSVERFVRRGVLSVGQEREEVREYVERLGVKTPSLDTPIANLSGGNQQKVVLGRWLIRKSKVLLMDQPTRGIDVGAKQEVYRMTRQLAAQGLSIIIISDELPELIGLSNRILVFRDRTIAKEFQCARGAKPNENDIIGYM